MGADGRFGTATRKISLGSNIQEPTNPVPQYLNHYKPFLGLLRAKTDEALRISGC